MKKGTAIPPFACHDHHLAGACAITCSVCTSTMAMALQDSHDCTGVRVSPGERFSAVHAISAGSATVTGSHLPRGIVMSNASRKVRSCLHGDANPLLDAYKWASANIY